ncbi:MAG: malto-oligosyltrehalose synthase, partial [Pedobacter sp.]
MHKPVSTYRIQFHKDFRFKHFKKIVPYLSKLGVQTIYASPILEASPGSMHGYDTVNPHRINPELGTEKELKDIAVLLKKHGMGWIQDIVPNHMAYHQNNLWLMDVLKKGPKSNYEKYFDINWAKGEFEPVMTPFLDSDQDDVVERGDISIVKVDDGFGINYNGMLWPINEKSDRRIKKANSLTLLNKDKVMLKTILAEQFYRLCSWQETDQEINYRRFFTVNNLICMNMQHPEVFEDYHSYIFELLGQGIFQGLRIDHIDGLYDPGVYLKRLRDAVGEDTYIVVEKILEDGEELPRSWPIQGTTGYEFLATVNNLFTNVDAEAEFSKFYKKISPIKLSIAEQIYQKKRDFLENHMGGELKNLCTLFYELELGDVDVEEQPEQTALKNVLGEFLIHCPIYRFYGMHFPLHGSQKKELEQIFTKMKDLIGIDKPALQLLRQLLFKENVTDEQAFQDKITRFFKRCMQFSGPLMAKGVEDTLMYTYNRFVGNNEVGDSPEGFGISIATFHERMVERQKSWPLALSASATHDTKRGEDVRARLNVLTDESKGWIKLVKAAQKHNRNFKIGGQPDQNDEYLIYQTISGTLPMPGEQDDDYQVRISSYLEKALREAKRKTNWAAPTEHYEAAAQSFAVQVLEDVHPFHDKFTNFQEQLSEFGIINSLSQMVLKFTAPGIPDVYQGTELWDLSLVDPDNRRPVDYELRENWLTEFTESHAAWSSLWDTRNNGKIKLCLQSLLLKLRKTQDYTLASYIPLKVKGKYKKHILAFARVYQREWTVTVIPVQFAAIPGVSEIGFSAFDWEDTRVILPTEAPEDWTNLIGREVGKQKKGIFVRDIFTQLPLAVLTLKHSGTSRAAGILMHLTSLPSAFGIGDMGPEALSFVDFLSAGHQKYWQLLPLNPITSEQSFSPYSSYSSMAGNVMLISPEMLLEDGILKTEELRAYEVPADDVVDYTAVENRKSLLLKLAYGNFLAKGKQASLFQPYQDFIKMEDNWLDDFSLFAVLKDAYPGKEWIAWPEPLRNREAEALQKFRLERVDEIAEVKWLQFVFFKQW